MKIGYWDKTEFEASLKAREKGINNSVPDNLLPNINALVTDVLIPIRDAMKSHILFTSGYRCPAVNTEVGGASNSDHKYAAAVDCHPTSVGITQMWDTIMKLRADGKIKARLIIWEFGTLLAPKWIHLSVNNSANRYKNNEIVFIGVSRPSNLSAYTNGTPNASNASSFGTNPGSSGGSYIHYNSNSIISAPLVTYLPPKTTSSNDYGLLTGAAIYYNNIVDCTLTIIDPSTGEEVEVNTTIEYDLGNEEETLEVEIITASDALSTESEIIGGISYNTDGTYISIDLLSTEQILVKVQNVLLSVQALSMGCLSAGDTKTTTSTFTEYLDYTDISLASEGKKLLTAILNIKSAVDKYGNAIRNGLPCPVCGKVVKYMPTLGYCSIECFTKDLLLRTLTNMKPDDNNPINKLLSKIVNILDFFNLVLNVLMEFPDILKNSEALPLEWKNFVMVYINMAFVQIRIMINQLMIMKNDAIILILSRIQHGIVSGKMKKMFTIIEPIMTTIDALKLAFETAYAIAVKALDIPAIGIEPESYAWVVTPRSMMNGDGTGKLIINLPNAGMKAKLIETMSNINFVAADEFVKKIFPPILPAEYFMEPTLFDARLLFSDLSDLVKKTYELLEMFLVFGCDYIPRWRKLSLLNPFYILAILDGWGPHGMRDYGSLIQPTI